MDSKYYTVDEIADLLRLNPQTVRNWIDAGEIRAIRVGTRRVRVGESELERYLGLAAVPSESAGEARDYAGTEQERPAQWARFGAALTDATSALGREALLDLAGSLEVLASAANSLAQALLEEEQRAGAPGSADPPR